MVFQAITQANIFQLNRAPGLEEQHLHLLEDDIGRGGGHYPLPFRGMFYDNNHELILEVL